MARYVDIDKLIEVLDQEALILTQNKLVKYYDRTIALYHMKKLSFEVEEKGKSDDNL